MAVVPAAIGGGGAGRGDVSGEESPAPVQAASAASAGAAIRPKIQESHDRATGDPYRGAPLPDKKPETAHLPGNDRDPSSSESRRGSHELKARVAATPRAHPALE